MIAADLNHANVYAIGLGRRLCFDDGNWDPVDHEDDIAAISVPAVCKGPFAGDMKCVSVGVLEVDDADVDFALLCLDVNRLLSS